MTQSKGLAGCVCLGREFGVLVKLEYIYRDAAILGTSLLMWDSVFTSDVDLFI